MHYWNSLPQDDDGLAELDVDVLLDMFDYCGIKINEDDAQVTSAAVSDARSS